MWLYVSIPGSVAFEDPLLEEPEGVPMDGSSTFFFIELVFCIVRSPNIHNLKPCRRGS